MPELIVYEEEWRRCGEVFEKDGEERAGACEYCQWNEWHEEASSQ